MKDRRLTRLIIYLIVSICIILFLWYLPNGGDRSIKNHNKTGSLNNSLNGIPVDIPDTEELIKPSITISIDSNQQFFIDTLLIGKEYIEDYLKTIFDKTDSLKRGFVIQPSNKANAENLVFLLDLANKNKWKVGIFTKN